LVIAQVFFLLSWFCKLLILFTVIEPNAIQKSIVVKKNQGKGEKGRKERRKKMPVQI
jgi:hypothetical protein